MRMLVVVCLFLLWRAPHAWADTDGCGAIGNGGAVSMTILDAPVSYDFTRSTGQIADLASAGGLEKELSGVYRGLTATAFQWKVDVRIQSFARNDGFCMWPTAATVTIGFTPIMVYVENDYPGGSCQRAAIVEHENRHVAANRAALAVRVPAIRDAAQAALNSGSFPIWTPDLQAGQQSIVDAVSHMVAAEADYVSQVQAEMNAEIDAPSSIAYTEGECPSW